MPTPLIYTLEITLVVDDAGTQATFYFSTRGFASKPSDTPVSTYFLPLIKSPGNLRSELFSGARLGGAVRPAFGEIELNNIDGELDDWINYGIAAGRVVVRFGPMFGAYPSAFTTCYVGYAHALTVDTKTVKIRLRSRDYLLDKPAVTATFEGTGGLEGTGNTSTKKRLVIGDPGYIPLIPVDANKLIYFVQANACDVRALAGTSPPYYFAFDGGVRLDHGGYYGSATDILTIAADEGNARLWADSGDGTSGSYQSSVGPVYVRLGSEPEADMRFRTFGYLLNDQGERIRQWKCSDLALRAGIADVETNYVERPGHYTPSVGNRVIDGDTSYTAVLNDVATYELGVWGFDRLDRWFTSRILGPEETGDASDVVAYEFDQHNVKGFARSAIPGQEAPVWQVNVASGNAYPCQTLGAADPDVRDEMGRDPWQAIFTGTNDDVHTANPGAVVSTVEIQGHEFKDKATKQRWVDRYIYLYGRRSSLFTITTERFSSVDLAADLLAIDVGDKVRVTYPRFGCDAGVTMRVITVTRDLQARNITLGLWSGAAGPASSVLGGGSSSDSSAGGTGKKAFVVGVQYIDPLTQIAQSTIDSESEARQYSLIGDIEQITDSSVTTPASTSVVLLIHGDSSVVDSSSGAKTIIGHNGASYSATQSKFGGGALFFDGSNDYFTTPDHGDFNFAGQDWSVDFWLYLAATPNTAQPLVCQWADPSDRGWYIGADNTRSIRLGYTSNGVSTTFSGTTTLVALNTWTHVAVWRKGNTGRIALNGTIEHTTSLSVATFFNSTTSLGIGALGDGSAVSKSMYMDELRICVGTIDYATSNFTPPTSAY